MPLQRNDAGTEKMKKTNPDFFGKDEKGDKQNTGHLDANEDVDANIKSEPNQANYGFAGDAKLNTEAEETEAQEYQADGLPRTNKYSVDKTSKGINEQTERKGGSSCDC